jgi:hypothetical protein
MYTFIKRTAPPPSLLIFDAGNRDQCEVRRLRTNTPLQALVMLNDPQILEASRVLAQTLLQRNESDEAKFDYAFRRILCRRPQKNEMQLLTEYYNNELKKFQKDPNKAKQFTNVGEYPIDKKSDPAQLAAMMQLIHTMYNLEETSTKS